MTQPGKLTDGTKSGGKKGQDGERRKTYSAAVIDGFKRNRIRGYRNSKRMAVNGMVKQLCEEEEVG